MTIRLIRASALTFCATLAVAAASAAPLTLPFSEVRAGMKGTGKTVFHGETIETFDVEIVGVLPNIGPGQNLILGRCTGGPLAQTGVLAGMSGSPVTIDGKLVGAVAYSWGFSKEAIAGITPIDEMLGVGAREKTAQRRARSATALPWADALTKLQRPASLGTFLVSRLAMLAAAPAGAAAKIPLSVSGIDSAAMSRIAPELARAGFGPLQSAGVGAQPGERPARLQPGSAVGVKLVRGDIDLTATGTVTLVDGDDLYAFGHPLYGLGDIDMPMTAARIETLLPNLESSSKVAVPLQEAGAFRQDRQGAIFGRIGATPAMVPVRLQLTDGAGGRRTFAFDLVDDPLLSPVLLYTAINGVLDAAERTFGSATIRVREGSVIKVDGSLDVRLDNLFAGDQAAGNASGLPAFLLYLLMNNEWSAPHVSGINLILDYDREPRSVAVRRVTLDRYRVTAGSAVTANIVLAPYRGADHVLTRTIEIPEETPEGPLMLQFGDAATINRMQDIDGSVVPRSLEQLVTLINRLKRNDHLYILASRLDNGVFLGGARLPNLPPAVTSILTRPRSFGNYTSLPERGLLEDDVAVDGDVDGYVRVAVEVVAR